MAEVQNNPQSGEMTRRFIEFVLMQAQQIALLLGHMPGPEGKPMEANLPVARIFIDQLEMIREKTRGNLTDEEANVLNKVLADLQLAFVEAGNKSPAPATSAEEAKPAASSESPAPSSEADGEEKKKFTKSYG